MKLLRFILISFVLCSQPVVGDFGWVPKDHTLIVRVGGEFIGSSENFGRDGVREDISFQNQNVKFSQNRIFTELEYSFAPTFSALLWFGFGSAKVTPQSGGDALLSASNFGDFNVSIKKNFRKAFPVLTAESYFIVPTNSQNAQADELLMGNGAFGLGVKLHTGFRFKLLFFNVTPGILFRVAGYSSAFTVDTAIGIQYKIVYGYVFADYFGSFTETLLRDSSLTVHDANGTGGSQLRLAGSPSNLSLGLNLGVKIYKAYGAELGLSQTLRGTRAPNYFRFTLNFRGVFDFYTPDDRIKVKEVPFRSEQGY